jgi:hypothetical protein
VDAGRRRISEFQARTQSRLTTVGVNGSVARARAELLRRRPSSAREGPPERLASRSRAPCVA